MRREGGPMARKVGICTGGGDAPGLNAVIRAFVKTLAQDGEWEVIGIEDAFNGLLETPHRLQRLDPRSSQGLLHRGGTVLGTTNRGNPFHLLRPDGTPDRTPELVAAARALGLEGIVSVGGDGSLGIALRLMRERGLPMIGVPKTIDNDLSATDWTFGFQSAVEVARDALDRLHTTAESHDRVMFLEVMGRDTGHIALHAGIAGGADVILLPEIPWDAERVAQKILARRAIGRSFTLVVVAEGAVPTDLAHLDLAGRKRATSAHGGAGALAMQRLHDRVDAEMRLTVLGHLQRGGSPIAFDRILATRLGVGAAELVKAGRWGEMVRIHHDHVDGVPLEAAVSQLRLVDPAGQLVQAARAIGVEFGA
jgi:phosphofructokinase-like protein